jgi:hypothetical protein
MNNAFKISTAHARRTPDMGIDWEFQPSLQHLVLPAESARQHAPAWAETMPVSFEAMNESTVFQEPFKGLSVREMNEPEIFRLFFGGSERAGARA